MIIFGELHMARPKAGAYLRCATKYCPLGNLYAVLLYVNVQRVGNCKLCILPRMSDILCHIEDGKI